MIFFTLFCVLLGAVILIPDVRRAIFGVALLGCVGFVAIAAIIGLLIFILASAIRNSNEPPSTRSADVTLPSERTVQAPKLEQNPLTGLDKKKGESKDGFASNISKIAENTRPIPNRIEGVKNVPMVNDPSVLTIGPVPRLQGRPTYPSEMHRAGIRGEVVVDFIVDANGDVQNAFAVKMSRREFESAAVECVSQWKFNPGRKDGRNVNTHMQVPIVFNLDED